jgi:uncharacterized protein (TIGR02246 family)
MPRAALLIFALLTASLAHAQSDDVAAIKALNEAWIHGYATKDTAALSHIWADDFVLVNPAGMRVYKQDLLHNMASPTAHFLSSRVDTVEVHVFGNIGYIMARAAFVTTDDSGKETKGKTDYLDVYEKRKGHWVAIAAHVIYLGDQP